MSASRPTSLAAIADHFLGVYDDLFEADEEVDLSHEADVREVLRRNYLSGDCQAFAVALHDHLGLPIVALNGGIHVAVQCPDGRLMDYAGVATPSQMNRRYGTGAPVLTPWNREEAYARACLDLEDEGDPWSPVALAQAVIGLEQRWSLPPPTSRPRPRRRLR